MRPVRRITAHCFVWRVRATHGMTLIELMVATFVLLVAMAGIVPLFITGLSQASTIRLKSVATNIAREKMEDIRQLDYREIYTQAMAVADPTLGTRTLESLFGTSETVRGATFNISYLVTNQAYQTGTLKEVTVNVGWTAPPAVSPASITTLVHQQFLGPRGSYLDITPTYPDPLGTPFSLIANNTTACYYVAQADWGLVYYDLSQATLTPRNVYMTLSVVDSNGVAIPLGPSSNNNQIDTSYLHYSRDATGAVNAVWFEYPFDASVIPDGYWEMDATIYNEYGEPGNTWRLRLRTETGAPAAPTSFTATAQSDNQTVVLNWLPGPERDRAYWVLQRRTWNYTNNAWLPWVTLNGDLDPDLSTYTDVGNVASGQDPWGNSTTQNYYQYSLWAVDICNPGNVGASAQAQTYVPSATTTTTTATTTTSTSTTTTSSTTSTTSLVSVTIVNSSNTSYSVTISCTSPTSSTTVTAKKNKTTTVSGLVAGSWYQATYTSSSGNTVSASFQAGVTPNPVLTITS